MSIHGLTRVVNMRSEECDVYCGRPSFLGNPYRIGEYTREESIEKFRIYFYKRIKKDKNFRQRVKALKGKRIGCWCEPLPCHLDIVAEYLNKREWSQDKDTIR